MMALFTAHCAIHLHEAGLEKAGVHDVRLVHHSGAAGGKKRGCHGAIGADKSREQSVAGGAERSGCNTWESGLRPRRGQAVNDTQTVS